MQPRMIDVTPIDYDKGQQTLSVKAPWEEVAADYEDILEQYSKIRIAGFRSGKTPRDIIESRFVREILDRLSQRCSRRLSREALKQIGAEPMGPVEITGIDCGKGKPFQFVAKFSPVPEFELPDLGSLKFTDDTEDLRDQISAKLLEIVNFEVPDVIIETELGREMAGRTGRGSAEWKAAAERVRLILILKKIAGREGIEIGEEDIERRIKEKAMDFGMEPSALSRELEAGGGKQRLRDMLLAESTLDFLIEISRGKS